MSNDIFTEEQLTRLAVYKAAIDAGFYSDNPLQETGASFTPQQIARLAVYRAAVRAGFYNDGSSVKRSKSTS
jgi:hypothetical protein